MHRCGVCSTPLLVVRGEPVLLHPLPPDGEACWQRAVWDVQLGRWVEHREKVSA